MAEQSRFVWMTGESGSKFGAAGPALGYLAQVDYALLAALERMDDEDDFTMSVETLDDIVFHDAETDDATEKWQSKHTIRGNSTLSDASTELKEGLGAVLPVGRGGRGRSR
jgi:hypothetical protein